MKKNIEIQYSQVGRLVREVLDSYNDRIEVLWERRGWKCVRSGELRSGFRLRVAVGLQDDDHVSSKVDLIGWKRESVGWLEGIAMVG